MVWKIDYYLDCLVNCNIHFKTFIGCDGEGKEKKQVRTCDKKYVEKLPYFH